VGAWQPAIKRVVSRLTGYFVLNLRLDPNKVALYNRLTGQGGPKKWSGQRTGEIFMEKGSLFWWIKYYNADGSLSGSRVVQRSRGVAVELLKTRFKERGLGMTPKTGKNLRL